MTLRQESSIVSPELPCHRNYQTGLAQTAAGLLAAARQESLTASPGLSRPVGTRSVSNLSSE